MTTKKNKKRPRSAPRLNFGKRASRVVAMKLLQATAMLFCPIRAPDERGEDCTRHGRPSEKDPSVTHLIHAHTAEDSAFSLSSEHLGISYPKSLLQSIGHQGVFVEYTSPYLTPAWPTWYICLETKPCLSDPCLIHLCSPAYCLASLKLCLLGLKELQGGRNLSDRMTLTATTSAVYP